MTSIVHIDLLRGGVCVGAGAGGRRGVRLTEVAVEKLQCIISIISSPNISRSDLLSLECRRTLIDVDMNMKSHQLIARRSAMFPADVILHSLTSIDNN